MGQDSGEQYPGWQQGQGGPYGQPPQQQPGRYLPPWPPQGQQQRYQGPPQPRHQAPPRRQPGVPLPWIAGIAAIAVVIAAAAFFVLHGHSPSPSAAGGTSQGAGQPETEAGARAAATQFYALYSAGQWDAAWQMLAPASQAKAPEAVYVAVHQGCPSASTGLAREIKSVTMAGPTAVVTETVAGVMSSLGSVTDTWQYAGGRWGFVLDAKGAAAYSHGSAAADIAAAKAAGQCAG